MTATTMRAIVQRGYGGVEVLSLDEVPIPVPKATQVLVQVHAVSPDSGTVHLMTGRPTMLRPFVGLRTPRQPVIGLAFAGIVHAVGDRVQGFSVGDRVAGTSPAAFADYVVASPAKLAHMPDGVSMADAATLPVSASTALQAVRDTAKVHAGQRVAVIGAGGGVGSFLTQLAVLEGARVTGVASAAKAAFVRSLGAERVIDYRVTPDPGSWGSFDVVFDAADGRPTNVMRRALSERGTLVSIGADHAGGPVMGGFDRPLRASMLSPWVSHRLTSMTHQERGADVEVLLDHLAAGRLRAQVAEVASLDAAIDVIDRLHQQRISGKAVIELRSERASETAQSTGAVSGPEGS